MGNNGRMSSPMKTAKPSTQSELEDMSRELSMAFSPEKAQETSEESSLFTKLIGINQEKVNMCTRSGQRFNISLLSFYATIFLATRASVAFQN